MYVSIAGRKCALSLLSPPSLSGALVLGALLCGASAASAQSTSVEAVTQAQPQVLPAEFNGDLSKLPALPFGVGEAPPYRPLLRRPPTTKVPSVAPPAPSAPEFVGGPRVPMPSPIQNFAGMSKTDACTGGSCGSGWPPDPNGDVGPNHYIQAVNTSYAIYNKTGTRLAAFTENQLFLGSGLPQCDGHAAGDPIVLYDWLADRWILTHLAFSFSSPPPPASPAPTTPFYQCIAASKTSDPVAGGWWLYAVRVDPGGAGLPPVNDLNDYPKFGLWHDCLYMASNEFRFPAGNYDGVAFASFSRADLYSGAPLTFGLGWLPPANNAFTMIPSHNQGKGVFAVQPGTPNYFVSESGTLFTFEVRKLTAGLNCGGGGTLSALTNVSQTGYFFASLGAEVPQPPPVPPPATLLDNIDDRLMQKVQYRRIGSVESLWVAHNVDPCTNGPCSTFGPTGMQWAQINVTGGTIATTPVQQQIYAPDATLYRWMGSIAVDSQGNAALGYSTSNGSAPNYPSIAYSGRLATDPANTLPQTEVQMVAGAGSQNNVCGGVPCDRWGDYSAMSLDPADGCTFWYTNEYYGSQANGDAGNWQTRIGSFKFPSCTTATTRVLVPNGTSESQTFTAYPETRWFAMTVEPGKTYVIDTVDPSGDLTANAIGTLNVFAGDGVSAPPEANVDCTAANGPRPPAVDVASDGIRCVLRTALPNGTLLNKRPVYIKVTRMDPATGGGSQFKIRAREATIYGRWLTAGYDYHVEVENTTGDTMCVEVARYPASGLTYTPGPGWSGAIASFTLTVPAFGAVKQVIPNGNLVGSNSDGPLRISACNSPVNLIPGALHVSTFAFDTVASRFIYFFTTTANDGKTRSTW
jgi:hypothetical protein